MTPPSVPLFPLRIVLFPGIPQLLHVFEPRYRQLLADCLDGDRRFGLPLLKDHVTVPEPGDVGCTALIKADTRLPDGRSNILIEGERRFALESIDPSDHPYFAGTVRFFDDEPGGDDAIRAVQDVWNHLKQLESLLGANRTAETMPADATRASFKIAGRLDLDLDTAEALLRLTSATVRLEHLESIIQDQHAQAQEALKVTNRHRGNGKHGYSSNQSEPYA